MVLFCIKKIKSAKQIMHFLCYKLKCKKKLKSTFFLNNSEFIHFQKEKGSLLIIL